jgi:hypothetical protein
MAHRSTKVNRGATISTLGRRHEDGLLLRKRYSEIGNCRLMSRAAGVRPHARDLRDRLFSTQARYCDCRCACVCQSSVLAAGGGAGKVAPEAGGCVNAAAPFEFAAGTDCAARPFVFPPASACSGL